jgi:hypothetical protein
MHIQYQPCRTTLEIFRGMTRAPARFRGDRYYWNPELDIRITYLQLFKHQWGLKGHDISWLEGKGASGEFILP